MLWTRSNAAFFGTQGKSKVNFLIGLEFELILDFMPVQIICKSRKDPIKTKKGMLQTGQIWSFSTLKGK